MWSLRGWKWFFPRMVLCSFHLIILTSATVTSTAFSPIARSKANVLFSLHIYKQFRLFVFICVRHIYNCWTLFPMQKNWILFLCVCGIVALFSVLWKWLQLMACGNNNWLHKQFNYNFICEKSSEWCSRKAEIYNICSHPHIFHS